jgi:1-acyl-sn-glycerol-3-phosphate acyltransferase
MGQVAAPIDLSATEQLRTLAPPGGLLVQGMRLLAAVAVRGWLYFYHRLTIVGRENLPSAGSFVLVANHASHLDTLCLLSALPMKRLHRAFPAAAKDYFCVNAVRALLAKVVVNALPFDRHLDFGLSLSVCKRVLEEHGTVLIFFPEGTRTGRPVPREFKPGIALLTAGRDIPVVPCHIAGTHGALPKGAWFPRSKALRLTIGEPRVYAHLSGSKESVKYICHDLREAVISLGQTQSEANRGVHEEPDTGGDDAMIPIPIQNLRDHELSRINSDVF